jgi:nucleoside-diphosphate-sugar epimerase
MFTDNYSQVLSLEVNMTERKKALVTGATGVVGGNLVLYLSGLDDWDVIGLSRRTPDTAGTIQHISVDLLDGSDWFRLPK